MDTGLFTSGRHPRTIVNEDERVVAVLAQKPPLGDKGRPLTDYSWNKGELEAYTNLRRVAQHAAGTGATYDTLFQVVGNDVTPNRFYLTGNGATQEWYPAFYVGGIPALLPSGAYYGVNSVSAQYLYRKTSAMAAGVQTVFEDRSAVWPSLAASGRTFYLMQNNGSWNGPHTISANTASTMTSVDSWTVGAGATEIPAAGTYYFIDVSTPGADRTDKVYIDVFLEEVGGTTPLAGTTAAKVTSTSVDEKAGETTLYESMRHWRINQAVLVGEGTTGIVDVIPSGLTVQDASSNLSTYTDTYGRKHYIAQIAQFDRKSGDAYIRTHMVQDTRKVLGAGLHDEVRDLFKQVFAHHFLETPTITRTSDTVLTIGAAKVIDADGRVRGIPSKAISNAISSTGVTCSASTNYYISVSPTYDCYVLEAAATGCPVLRAKVDGSSHFPALTVGANYETMWRVASGLADRFKFDVGGRIMANVAFGTTVESGTEVGYTLSWVDKDGTVVGRVGYFPSSGGAPRTFFEYAADAATAVGICNSSQSAAVIVGAVTGATAGNIYVIGDGTTGTVEAHTTTPALAGSTPPANWNLKNVRADDVRTPQVVFGNTSLAESTLSSVLYVPAAEGYLNYHEAAGVYNVTPAAYGPNIAYRRHYDTVMWDLDLTGFYGYLDATADSLKTNFENTLFSGSGTPGNGNEPFLVLPLRVPRGTKITKIEVPVRYALASGSVGLTVDLRVATRSTMTSVIPTYLTPGVDFAVTLDPAGGTAMSCAFTSALGAPANAKWTLDFSGAPLYLNANRLYLTFTANTGTFARPGTTNRVWFYGAQVTCDIRGIGHMDTGASTYISYPLEGM